MPRTTSPRFQLQESFEQWVASLCLVRCGAWGVFRRVQPTLGRTNECHFPEHAVDPSCDQDPRKIVAFLGRKITVNHNTAIFITMNPATKSYGGRQKLPDNLKQLLRPVARSVPDKELIAEVMSLPRVSRVHRPRLNALWRCSCCRTTAFCAATLRVGIPSTETHLFSRRSIAAGPQTPIALRLHLLGHFLGCLISSQSFFPQSFAGCPVTGPV